MYKVEGNFNKEEKTRRKKKKIKTRENTFYIERVKFFALFMGVKKKKTS